MSKTRVWGNVGRNPLHFKGIELFKAAVCASCHDRLPAHDRALCSDVRVGPGAVLHRGHEPKPDGTRDSRGTLLGRLHGLTCVFASRLQKQYVVHRADEPTATTAEQAHVRPRPARAL